MCSDCADCPISTDVRRIGEVEGSRTDSARKHVLPLNHHTIRGAARSALSKSQRMLVVRLRTFRGSRQPGRKPMAAVRLRYISRLGRGVFLYLCAERGFLALESANTKKQQLGREPEAAKSHDGWCTIRKYCNRHHAFLRSIISCHIPLPPWSATHR